MATTTPFQLNGSPVSSSDTAFRELFNSTYADVLAYARRRSFNQSDADDVVADVYATAWRRREDLDPGSPALPWLYGIAANVLRNQWRAGGRQLRLVERLEAQPAASSGQGPATDPAETVGGDMRAALSGLSFDDQEVLRLVAWEGLSHAEVGLVLGCSANAVGIRLHRAKQRLQTELEKNTELENDTNSKIEDDQRRGGATR